MNQSTGEVRTKRQRIAAWLKRERERAIVAAVTQRIAPEPLPTPLVFAQGLIKRINAREVSPARALELVKAFSTRLEREHA